MYGSIRVYSGASELADALVENAGEIEQLISGIDGFTAYYLVRTPDGAASISVFDDEAGAKESNNVARAWVGENLPDLSISPPQVSAGEVVLDF